MKEQHDTLTRTNIEYETVALESRLNSGVDIHQTTSRVIPFKISESSHQSSNILYCLICCLKNLTVIIKKKKMPLTEKPLIGIWSLNNNSFHSLFSFHGHNLTLYMSLFDYFNFKRNWWPSDSPTSSQPSRIPQLAGGVNCYVMWVLKSILVQLLKKYPYQSGSMDVEMNGMGCVEL